LHIINTPVSNLPDQFSSLGKEGGRVAFKKNQKLKKELDQKKKKKVDSQ